MHRRSGSPADELHHPSGERHGHWQCAVPSLHRPRMSLAILVTFLLGIGNFALHKAVMESGHPLLGRMPWFYHALNGNFSLVVEFLMLLAALLFVAQDSFAAAVARSSLPT